MADVEYLLQLSLGVDFWVKLWVVCLIALCRFTWKKSDFQIMASLVLELWQLICTHVLGRNQQGGKGVQLRGPSGKFRAIAAMAFLVLLNVFASQDLTDSFRPDYNLFGPILSVQTIDLTRTKLACVSTFNREALPEQERGMLVFTAPPTLQDLPMTMKSWDVALRNRGRLVVFTNDPETRAVCAKHDIPTLCVEHVDEGLPRLDKMFDRMEKSQPDGIVAFVNSDIEVRDYDVIHEFLLSQNRLQLEILRPDEIYMKFESTGRMSQYWFATLTRQDISEDGQTAKHAIGGYDFWAWNLRPGGIPLLPFEMPPFRFPLAIYDNWLFDVVNQAAQRNVIDATNVAPIYHQNHKAKSQGWYELLQKGVTGVYINRYLGFSEPRKSLLNPEYSHVRHLWQFGTTNEAPYYVVGNGTKAQSRLSKRRYWSDLPESELSDLGCLHNSLTCTRTEFIKKKTNYHESWVRSLPYTTTQSSLTMSAFEESAAEMWRYTLEEQLKIHANEDGYILVTAVNYIYRDHLMNWICSLERVGMSNNFLVAALDEEMYKWGMMQGLPIFKATIRADSEEVGTSGYGSSHFRVVTKLKSKVVLEVLKAGYSVVWSDVDITWFAHPFDALARYMNNSTGIVIQSNAPYVANPDAPAIPHSSVSPVKTDDPTARRRLNSGLYVATSNKLVISAFEEIIDDARIHSADTEQPSFDAILCKRSPSERHYKSCIYRPAGRWKDAAPPDSQLLVQSLDRFSFPNGAILVGESNKNVYTLGKELFEKEAGGVPLYAAHNNWIQGESAKKGRQLERGWWFTDDSHSCTYLQE